MGYLQWAPYVQKSYFITLLLGSQAKAMFYNVTGEKMQITFSPTRDQIRSAGLEALHSSLLLKAGLYCREYKCVIYLYRVIFSPSKLKFVREFLGVQESHEMRLKEFYVHMWVIYIIIQI